MAKVVTNMKAMALFLFSTTKETDISNHEYVIGKLFFYTQFFVELLFYNYEPPPFSTLWTYSKGLTIFWSIPVDTALFPCVGRSLQISGQGWKFSAIVSSIYFASFQVEEVSAWSRYWLCKKLTLLY